MVPSGHEGLEMAAEGGLLRKGCPGCPGEPTSPTRDFLLLLFLPWRAAGREAELGARAPASLALSRREEAALRLGPSPAELAPGTEGTCSGSRAGLQPPASLSARSEASLKLFDHSGMWYFKWLF